jgi:hypothetical protein
VIDLSEVISPAELSCLKQVRDKACVAIRSADIVQSASLHGKHLGLVAVGEQLPSMLACCQNSSPSLSIPLPSADSLLARHNSCPGYKHQNMPMLGIDGQFDAAVKIQPDWEGRLGFFSHNEP